MGIHAWSLGLGCSERQQGWGEGRHLYVPVLRKPEAELTGKLTFCSSVAALGRSYRKAATPTHLHIALFRPQRTGLHQLALLQNRHEEYAVPLQTHWSTHHDLPKG